MPGGITEQSGMGVRNHCRNQFLKNCQITQKWDPITLHFIDWPTKHTQTELAKSIRLWESISSIKWAHTVNCKHRSYSYHSLVLGFSELNFPSLVDQAEKALTAYNNE